jgi:RNA-directed DNA polymerase
MSKLKLLKAAQSLRDVAILFGFKPAALAYLLYIKPTNSRYHAFQIPKRSGGARNILSPGDDLKLLQQRLSSFLQDCVREANDAHGWEDRYAHGFTRFRSIITNAEKHRDRRYVFNLDLENFFPSINFGRVRGFFLKNRTFAVHPKVATVLAQIACHENSLPQGSPCSPVLSNLIGHILDVRLCRLATISGCTYSRYADDITFSTNRESFPEKVAKAMDGIKHRWVVGDSLRDTVASSGFTINHEKTRMQYRDSRQDVTGLVVNRRVNTRPEYRSTIRAMVYRLRKTGKFHVDRWELSPSGVPLKKQVEGAINQLQGMLAHIYTVDQNRPNMISRQALAQRYPGLERENSRERLYRHFLLYKEFYSATKPTIICEGKTDIVYIRNSIKSLAVAFPLLASNANTAATLNVRIFRFPNTITGKILGLHDGGVGNMCKLVSQYLTTIKRFTAPVSKEPVIMLVDNDQGGKSVYDAARKFNQAIPPIGGNFAWVRANLYLVCTPLEPNQQTSVIEDCFSGATLGTRINGRSFSPADKYDPGQYYGKNEFSEMIEQSSKVIDFSGFSVLLSRLEDVLRAHRAKQVP